MLISNDTDTIERLKPMKYLNSNTSDNLIKMSILAIAFSDARCRIRAEC